MILSIQRYFLIRSRTKMELLKNKHSYEYRHWSAKGQDVQDPARNVIPSLTLFVNEFVRMSTWAVTIVHEGFSLLYQVYLPGERDEAPNSGRCSFKEFSPGFHSFSQIHRTWDDGENSSYAGIVKLLFTISSTEIPLRLEKETSVIPFSLASLRLSREAKPPSEATCRGGRRYNSS